MVFNHWYEILLRFAVDIPVNKETADDIEIYFESKFSTESREPFLHARKKSYVMNIFFYYGKTTLFHSFCNIHKFNLYDEIDKLLIGWNKEDQGLQREKLYGSSINDTVLFTKHWIGQCMSYTISEYRLV